MLNVTSLLKQEVVTCVSSYIQRIQTPPPPKRTTDHREDFEISHNFLNLHSSNQKAVSGTNRWVWGQTISHPFCYLHGISSTGSPRPEGTVPLTMLPHWHPSVLTYTADTRHTETCAPHAGSWAFKKLNWPVKTGTELQWHLSPGTHAASGQC